MMLGRKQLLIGGEWRDAADGTTMPVLNPATEEIDRRSRRRDAATMSMRRWRRRVPHSPARGARCRRASADGCSGSSASG